MSDDLICKRCENPFSLRGDAGPPEWCDDCAQIIAASLKKAFADIKRKMVRKAGVSGDLFAYLWEKDWILIEKNIKQSFQI
jgi:hypothetical protein